MHLKLLREAFQKLGTKTLKEQLSDLMGVLQQKGLKLGIRKQYAETFVRRRARSIRLRHRPWKSMPCWKDLWQLNAEFGFSLQVPAVPSLEAFAVELDGIEQNHMQYLSVGNALKLVQPEFAERLGRALSMRLRTVFESAANDLELWSKSATAQLDAQLRERRRSFARRIEAGDRIQQAATGLEERIADEDGEAALDRLDKHLHQLTEQLMHLADDPEEIEHHEIFAPA